VNIPGGARGRSMAGMERPFLHSLRFYALAAMAVVFVGLAAWAAWGSPSAFTLAWVAAVSAGLVVSIALAVRDGSPTRSVAHVLYDAEHADDDTAGAQPQRATTGAMR
jgi:hypothetical protein